MTLRECNRKTTCYDCKNTDCHHYGEKISDCPKYRCDRTDGLAYDCDHCAFIDRYIDGMRKEYGYEY